MKMIGWDDEFGGAQVGREWLWGILGYFLGAVSSAIFLLTLPAPCKTSRSLNCRN